MPTTYKRLDENGASTFAQKIFEKVKRVTDSIPSGGSGSGSGDTNIIEEIQVNGIALTPDANKAVNVPVPKIQQVTYAQYNALTQAQKTDGTLRFITDIDHFPNAEGVGF